MTSIRQFWTAVVILIWVQTVSATDTSQVTQEKLREVALFKNGLGYFISDLTVPPRQREFSFEPKVIASHGTYWAAYGPDLKVDSLIAEEVDTDQPVQATHLEEVLQANIGAKVRLYLNEGSVEGTIKHITQSPIITPPDPYTPGRGLAYQQQTSYYQPSSKLIIIETTNGETVLYLHQVLRMERLDGKMNLETSRKVKQHQVRVRLNQPADHGAMVLSCLAKGITWAPSYIVDVSEPEKATLSAKAVIINEACDLEDVSVSLVTGYPHLRFADVASPLAMKENLAAFLKALNEGKSQFGSDYDMSSVMSQSAPRRIPGMGGGMGGGMMMNAPAPSMPAYGAAVSGVEAEDLFFYPLDKIQLKKGQTGYFPLFTETVKYEHIYQWDIPNYINEWEGYSYNQRNQRDQDPQQIIWHCLRLDNSTNMPWTTAPAQTVRDDKILGQDIIKYTASGADTLLKITQAMSVSAEQVELEKQRERDVKQLYGYHWDLVTVEGKLQVVSHLDKIITLEITKMISGTTQQSEPQAKVEKLASNLRVLNESQKLTWTIKLEPAKPQNITYEYSIYIRR